MDLFTPSSPGGLPTLSLTTNSSWSPPGEGFHASHQPLMPVLQHIFPSNPQILGHCSICLLFGAQPL